MTLQLTSTATRGGRMLADWGGIAQGVELGTNEHGFADLTAFVQLPPPQAFAWFDRAGLPWIEAWGDELAWQGRLEDVRLVDGGIQIVALGAWSAFGDVPYTATPASPTQSDVIVRAILAAARADNPDQLSPDEWRILAPGVDVFDEDYTDARMADILTRLAGLGDDQDPPARWEVGVWEDGLVHFRPRGSDSRTWYTDLPSIEIERSLAQVINSVYTRYDDGTSITGTAADAPSIARYGVTRRRALASRTTDVVQATRERDAALADGAMPIPRAGVTLDRVLTATGTPVPRWMVRSGDTLTIRNLPPDSGDLIDRIRTFRIAETRYRADDDTLTVVPESPLPTLDVLVARSLETAV